MAGTVTSTGQIGIVIAAFRKPGVGSIRTSAPWAGGLGITEPRRTEPSQATTEPSPDNEAQGRAKDGEKVAGPSPFPTECCRHVRLKVDSLLRATPASMLLRPVAIATVPLYIVAISRAPIV